MSQTRWKAILVCVALLACRAVAATPEKLPERIDVRPVFFVPKDGRAPSQDQIDRLNKHLAWSQKLYGELLPGRVTFSISKQPPIIYTAEQPLSFYRPLPADAVPQMVNELYAFTHTTRTTCPHVLLIVMMNEKDNFPGGGGQPFNGGFNKGGAVAVSAFHLNAPNFQSTLQHELGHAFGLPHVDCYGMSMQKSMSIMSYNPAHHTKGFEPSKTPGLFIPEDLRGLAMNQRAFPGLKFDLRRDIPRRYSIKPIVELGPMKL